MNRIAHFNILVLVFLFFFSCGKEDTKEYEFKDQEAQGKIKGKTFFYQSGSSKISGDTSEIFIDLYEAELNEPCNLLNQEQRYLNFRVPMEPGVVNLYFGVSKTSRVVTFYDLTVDNFFMLGLKGAVKINSIDSMNGLVKGEIDAWGDENNYINGYFEAKLCK